RRRHTRFSRDWSSDVCSSDLHCVGAVALEPQRREWHSLLREIFASPKREVELRRVLETDSFYGSKAALAWHMHANGELANALDRSEERRVGKEGGQRAAQ